MLFDGDSREFIHVLSSPRASSGRQSRGCHGDALIATRSPRCCKSSSARPKTNVRLAGQAKALRKSPLAKENITYHKYSVLYQSPATSRPRRPLGNGAVGLPAQSAHIEPATGPTAYR